MNELKFIVYNDKVIKGFVKYHKELIPSDYEEGYDKITGGGRFVYNIANDIIYVNGESEDFGEYSFIDKPDNVVECTKTEFSRVYQQFADDTVLYCRGLAVLRSLILVIELKKYRNPGNKYISDECDTKLARYIRIADALYDEENYAMSEQK